MTDLDRCYSEQQAAVDLLRAGHPDRRGLEQACEDWLAEEAMIRTREEERGE